MPDVCGMLIRPWHDDLECSKPAVGTHERTVRVCVECALAMRKEGFEVVYDSVVAWHFTERSQR